jgi:hypothetical protein
MRRLDVDVVVPVTGEAGLAAAQALRQADARLGTVNGAIATRLRAAKLCQRALVRGRSR